jgi:ATP-dependent exoDNAse (exonuclease V) beta subunit
MLTYEECKRVKNIDRESGRVYDTPIGRFPSVTTVLGQTADKTWLKEWIARVGEEEADRIKTAAAERGTILHDYLEKLYEQYDSPTIDEVKDFIQSSGLTSEKLFIQKMVKSLLKYLLVNNFKTLAQEFVVWDNELEIAGRCDSLGYWNDKLIVVDYKTSRRKKTKASIEDYFLQATAYCRAHNQMFNEQVEAFVILIAVEDGTSQIFTGLYKNYEQKLITRVNTYKGLND